MPEYMLFLAKTEGRWKGFLEWTSIDLSSKSSLTCGGNFNYYKSVHHPIPTLTVGIGTTQAIFKTNQQALLSTECPGLFSSWRGRPFLEGPRRGPHCEITPKSIWLRDEKSLLL